jgi:PAS domain S-box-containing protein
MEQEDKPSQHGLPHGEESRELPFAREDAERVRSLLAAIVTSSEDAIVSKTLNSIVTSWNEAAERLFGYTAAEMVGQSITRIIPNDLLYEEDEILAKLRRGERIERYETVRVRKDGEKLDISLTISPIRDTTGNIIGAAKIAHDITARRRAERALREREAELAKVAAERELFLESERAARSEAERLSHMKDEFLATLSHELRTPLNAIQGWARLLRERKVKPEEFDRGLETIDRNVGVQTQIVNDLLDMSRIISGKVHELHTASSAIAPTRAANNPDHSPVGRRTVNSLPCPIPALAAMTLPRCNSTRLRTTARPTPSPLPERASAALPCLKSSKM